MFLSMRGEVTVRHALGLALLSTILVNLVGCVSTKLHPQSKHYVRLDALVLLHPAWSQVVLLDRTISQFVDFKAGRPVLTYIPLTSPSAFTPPLVVPPNLASDRQQRLSTDVARYLTRLQQTLNARNEAVFQQFQRQERAATEKNYENLLAARIQKLRRQRNRESAELGRRIDALSFRAIALDSQIRVYIGQPRLDALVQRTKIVDEQAKLTAQHRELMANVVPDATADLIPVRSKLELDLRNRLAEKRTALDRDAKREIAQEQIRLQNVEPSSVTSIGSLAASTINPVEISLPSLDQNGIRKLTGNAQKDVETALKQEQIQWRAERARLCDEIRAEVVRSVEEIARQQNWILKSQTEPGVTDVTDQVRALLRSHWKTE